MQIRPVLFFVPVLCLSAGAGYLTSHDLQVQQALIAQQIQSQSQWDSYIEVDPNYLFYPEITYAYQDGNRAVVTICQKAESALSAPDQTLYLRAGNGQKSAAYFPYMSGTDAVWSYASFDDTSLEDARKAQLEYGTMRISYQSVENDAQIWDAQWEQEGDVIKGRLPTNAILPDAQQPVLNLLFYQGDTVVFADVIDQEQIKVASPVTFTWEPPFALPDFDRIEVRTL